MLQRWRAPRASAATVASWLGFVTPAASTLWHPLKVRPVLVLLAFLVTLATFLTGCGGSPIDVAANPRAESSSTATEAEGGHGAPVIEPPEGWSGETRGRVTVVSAAASPALIALTTLPLAATMKRIEQQASDLAAAEEVTVEGALRLGGLADRAQRMGRHKLALWELPDATRHGEAGAVLVFAGKLTETDLVVGIGFAVRDDLATSDAILAALATIAPAR